MKKIKNLLFLLPVVCLTGCSTLKSYSQLLEKIEEKGDGFTYYTQEEEGIKFVGNFAVKGDKISLDATFEDGTNYIEILLPLEKGDKAPEKYDCSFSVGTDKSEMKNGSFTLMNDTYDMNSTIEFTSLEIEPTDQIKDYAKDSVMTLVCSFNVWTLKNYQTSLTTLNIFPNFQYATVLLTYN